MKKLLVIRGDLRSHQGYSRALRAHLEVLAPHFDLIVGVDIHFDKNRSTQSFKWQILSDAEADSLINEDVHVTTLLNYTTPDHFRRHPMARNVGLFYWETDRVNPQLNWKNYIRLMDEMWLPAQFMRPMIEDLGFSGKILVLPWPQERTGPVHAPAEISFYEISPGRFSPLLDLAAKLVAIANFDPVFRRKAVLRLLAWLSRRPLRLRRKKLSEILRQSEDAYLSVAQKVPRKGIYLLLSEWLSFVETSDQGSLLIKTSTLNTDYPAELVCLELYDALKGLTPHRKNLRVYVCPDILAENEMSFLYQSVSAVVTTTLGEGFGGPIAEAGITGKIVIAPRHAAIDALLPPGYPLAMDADISSVSQKDQLAAYSISSRWGVIRPDQLASKLRFFESLSKPERTRIGIELREHVSSVCGIESVREMYASSS